MQCLVTSFGVFSLGLGTAQRGGPRTMKRLIGAEDTPWKSPCTRAGRSAWRTPAVRLWSRVTGDAADLDVLDRLLVYAKSRPGD